MSYCVLSELQYTKSLKSSFRIISPYSAGSICRFWHCQSSDPPVHPLITGHHWDSTSLFWILSHWSVFQGGLGRGGIQNTSTGHCGSPGIGSWTPPLLHIHYITGSHHTGAWLLPPLLRWWHTALSLFSTRWSNGSCTDLRLPGGHLGMDERTSPAAQPGKDWASGLPCHFNSKAWLHDSVRFINNYPINFGQKYWCNLWWPPDVTPPTRVRTNSPSRSRTRDSGTGGGRSNKERQRLQPLASVARAPLLKQGERGLHTVLTGIHPLHSPP